jgi:FdhD protein
LNILIVLFKFFLTMNKLKILHTEIVKIQSEVFEVGNTINDLVVIEQPLEIKIVSKNAWGTEEKSIAVTMRTPANDFELVIGFLFTEGVIQHISQVQSIRYCTGSRRKQEQENIVKVELKSGVKIDWERLQRNFYTTSSCGVCGKTAIDAVVQHGHFSLPIPEPQWNIGLIHGLSEQVRRYQTTYTYTGGLHASALFDVRGNLILLREDVGRHNALDKLIGAMLFDNQLPLQTHLLWLSGRIGFELVQKALMAGISTIVAVGAPSSLALELAQRVGMTLIGFARNQSFNVYHGIGRIITS